jgi:hypothetical protein
MKRAALAVILVFACWQVMDYLFHGVLLMGMYEETAELWRPLEEMKMGLMAVISFLTSICFVLIYHLLIQPKSMKTALIFGALFGFSAGIAMGYGTYATMPIPYHLALYWFLGEMGKMIVAGIVVGWVVKEPRPAALETGAAAVPV